MYKNKYNYTYSTTSEVYDMCTELKFMISCFVYYINLLIDCLIIPESRLPPYLFLRGCNNLWQIVLIVTMLAAKLQPRRLQPEDLRAYNAVLVVLPSVCLLSRVCVVIVECLNDTKNQLLILQRISLFLPSPLRL